MQTGQFLKKLGGNDFGLQLKIDRVLAGLYSDPDSLSSLENLPLREGAEELYLTFFSYVAVRLMMIPPGTDEWREAITEERVFFDAMMERCAKMRLPVADVVQAGNIFFELVERMRPIDQQLESIIESLRDEVVRRGFGVRPAES